MKIWLAFAAFVMLLAIIVCARMMKKGFTPLTSNQAMWRAKFKEEEVRLAKERMEITPNEQRTFLMAAVEDVIKLDNFTNLTCTPIDCGVKVEDSADQSWLLTYHAAQQKLKTIRKVSQGKAHWVLTIGDNEYDFERIDQLINAFRAALQNKPIQSLNEVAHFNVVKSTAIDSNQESKNNNA